MCSIAAGFKIEKLDCRLHRFANGCEEDEAQTFLAGQGRDLEFSGENRSKSSFAAGENVRQIIRRAQESFDAVAGPAFDQTRRPAFGHFGAGRVNKILDLRAFGAAASRASVRLLRRPPSANTISSEIT